MNKSELLSLKNIIQNLEMANEDLMSMLHLLNITQEEREMLENLVIATDDKIGQIKASKISQLGEHVNFDELSTTI